MRKQFGGGEHHILFDNPEDAVAIKARGFPGLVWRWGTPLGMPVEPDEYSQKATSSQQVSADSARSGCRARALA